MLRTIALAVAIVGAALPAAAADFTIDANHTQANFSVVHLAFSRVNGRIPVTGGAVSVGANGVPSSISVSLSAKDLDTNSADRDKDLRSADWFDVEKYPTMTFVSKSITGSPQAFTIVGELTMHGVTKPVTLQGKELGRMTDARGRTHLGYSATGTLDRREWGITWGKTTPGGALIAGNDITLDVTAEVIQKQ